MKKKSLSFRCLRVVVIFIFCFVALRRSTLHCAVLTGVRPGCESFLSRTSCCGMAMWLRSASFRLSAPMMRCSCSSATTAFTHRLRTTSLSNCRSSTTVGV